MRKIVFGVGAALVLVVFSVCYNETSLQGTKKETAAEIISQNQNAISNLETLDEPQIKKDTVENIPQSSSNEAQFDTEAPNQELKPLEAPTYIEQALIDLLKNSLDNNEYEVLKDKVSSKLLTKEEFAVIDLGGTENYLVEQIENYYTNYRSYYRVLLVDADNDGFDDIVIYLHSGGSAGDVDLIFYKGDEDGTFKKTYSSPFGFYTGNNFVSYNGKNYFLLTSVDYDRKVVTGFELYYFADGVLKESAIIQKIPESYTLSEKMVISNEYIAFAYELSEKVQEIYDVDDFIFKENIIGSGETKLSDAENKEANEMRKNARGDRILVISDWYIADIDNDGIYETYNKGVFEPSNYYTYRHLAPDFFKNSQEYDLQKEYGLDIWADNRIPQHLWIENVNNKNIVCIMSTKRFDKENIESKDEFVIECYYIQKNTYQTVVKLEYSPNYKISIEVYTQDINRDFLKGRRR